PSPLPPNTTGTTVLAPICSLSLSLSLFASFLFFFPAPTQRSFWSSFFLRGSRLGLTCTSCSNTWRGVGGSISCVSSRRGSCVAMDLTSQDTYTYTLDINIQQVTGQVRKCSDVMAGTRRIPRWK